VDVTSLLFLTKVGFIIQGLYLNNKINFERLLCIVVWNVYTDVSEELVPPLSGFYLKGYYYTAGRLNLKTITSVNTP
jgi:hypothetical protein